MKSAGKKIVRRKLSHEVADRLLEEIRGGGYPPGAKLPSERGLMERYGVGRPAVREAIQSLESMGLVEVVHGERATVKELDARNMFEQVGRTAQHLLQTSPQTLEDLKQARLLFETGMVKMAAEGATPSDVQRLAGCIEELEASSGDPDAFMRADIEFHIAIASISGNPIFAAVSEAMLSWLAEFHQDLVRAPGAERITAAEHREILARIAAHDAAGAVDAMTAHLTRANKFYRFSVP